jgi:hypothetical protein
MVLPYLENANVTNLITKRPVVRQFATVAATVIPSYVCPSNSGKETLITSELALGKFMIANYPIATTRNRRSRRQIRRDGLCVSKGDGCLVRAAR